MLLAGLVFTISVALFSFYLQVTAQRILRRTFDREYYQAIVAANSLEFPALRDVFEKTSGPIDYAQVRMTIKCDFLALTYLLKNAANASQRYSREERLLILYFQLAFVLLTVRRWLGLRVNPTVQILTAILQYFANVVGERVSTARFESLPAPNCHQGA
jgi:hypothetical protein